MRCKKEWDLQGGRKEFASSSIRPRLPLVTGEKLEAIGVGHAAEEVQLSAVACRVDAREPVGSEEMMMCVLCETSLFLPDRFRRGEVAGAAEIQRKFRMWTL